MYVSLFVILINNNFNLKKSKNKNHISITIILSYHLLLPFIHFLTPIRHLHVILLQICLDMYFGTLILIFGLLFRTF